LIPPVGRHAALFPGTPGVTIDVLQRVDTHRGDFDHDLRDTYNWNSEGGTMRHELRQRRVVADE
jgi:hypothetical protein